ISLPIPRHLGGKSIRTFHFRRFTITAFCDKHPASQEIRRTKVSTGARRKPSSFLSLCHLFSSSFNRTFISMDLRQCGLGIATTLRPGSGESERRRDPLGPTIKNS